MAKLPLSGIKVLDMGHLLPGPLAAVMLADLGAEVIKIEKPPRGDMNRYVPPLKKGMSPYFLMLNRNKKSKRINLKSNEGKTLFLKLVKKTDILIENFRPGVLTKLGVGYKQLSEINSKLIYCAISGYGQTGPWKNYAGHDLNYLGLSGLMYPTAFKGDKPAMLPTQLADIVGGSLLPVISILSALQLRAQTKKGMFIDSAMMPGSMMLLMMVLGKTMLFGKELHREQDRMTGTYPNYTVYKTKDKRAMVVAAIESRFWNKFCKVINKPAYGKWIPLSDPPGFPAPTLASYSQKELKNMRSKLQKIFLTKTQKHWINLFKGRPECCCTPVNNFNEALSFLKHLKRKDLIYLKNASGFAFPQLLFAWGNKKLSRKKHKLPPKLG